MLLHRHHIRAYLQIALVMLAFTSCVADKFAEADAELSVPDGTPLYLAIDIQSDQTSPSTRAGYETESGEKYEYGDKAEHTIGDEGNKILLFRGNDLYGVYDLTKRLRDDYLNRDEEGKSEELEENEEAAYRRVVCINTKKAEDLPTSCLVVLNGSEAICSQLDGYHTKRIAGQPVSLDDILKVIWTDTTNPHYIGYSNSDHDYFTLTNSMYTDGSTLKAPTDVKAKFYPTIPEAEADPAKIYVERMVAKFTFGLSENKNIFYPSEKADMIKFKEFSSDGKPQDMVKKWRVKVTGWNVNALETQSHLFKNITPSSNYFTAWNDAKNYRSYWSEDPHYDFELDANGDKTQNLVRYPWQYRRAVDYKTSNSGLDYYEDFANANPNDNKNALRNYSFEALSLGQPTEGDIANTFNERVVYVPENTYKATALSKTETYPGLDQRDDLLAGTHILVGAELQIEQTGEDTDYYVEGEVDYKTPKHLFRDRDGRYYLSERECIAYLVGAFNELLESRSKLIFTHYKDWNANGSSSEKLIADTEGNYSLYYKKTDADAWKELTAETILKSNVFSDDDLKMPIATIRRGDGKRLPWIEKLVENNWLAIGLTGQSTPSLSIYKAEPNDYGDIIEKGDKVPDTNNNHLKSLFYEWLGAIDHFDQGRMYYAVPVRNYKASTAADDVYGTVRNNWYRFTLNDVKAIGIPVDLVTQPIVPDRLELNDQVNFTIKIYEWHHVETNLPGFSQF